jgi:adenylate kinase family enzyme
MALINIRGTSGAGKSTLARQVMSLYPKISPQFVERRRRPISLLCSGSNQRPLFVLGHYEIPCGGGDTVSNRDEAFLLLRQARDRGCDVLFEGVVHSDEVRRTVELFHGQQGLVIHLDTPADVCIARIKQRRFTAGNIKPLNEAITRTRVAAIERACERLQEAGVPVVKLSAGDAFAAIRNLLLEPQRNPGLQQRPRGKRARLT